MSASMLGHRRRQRLDLGLARHLLHDAALLRAGRLPTSWMPTVAWIGRSSRTSWKSTCVRVPRMGWRW